jgi:hypothetical protein
MRWVLFVVGLLIGLIGGAGGMLYLVMQNKAAAETDEIVLAPKAFFDNDASVSASGTMTGDGLAYSNNSYSIGCYRDHKECWITGFEQIGPKQIGRMDAPYSYDIVKWTPYEVVAGDDGGIGCFKTTITISRKSKDVFWVEEPINQSKPFCKDADTKVRKRWLVDSPGWSRVHGSK